MRGEFQIRLPHFFAVDVEVSNIIREVRKRSHLIIQKNRIVAIGIWQGLSGIQRLSLFHKCPEILWRQFVDSQGIGYETRF